MAANSDRQDHRLIFGKLRVRYQMADSGLNIQLHPWAARRHKEDAHRSHFDGEAAELAAIVAEAMQDQNKVLPGKFPHTHVVVVKPDRFCAPGERHISGVFKVPARQAHVIVWSAQALAAERDPMAGKCTHAIVSIRAA